MTDKETIDQIFQWLREGEDCRDGGATSQYTGQSLAHQLHSYGWVKRDLQLGLCATKESYAASQIACGNVTKEQVPTP